MTATPTEFGTLPLDPAPQAKRSVLDAVGIGLSAACMVHCLALPALIVVLPQISEWMGAGHTLHYVLAIVLPLVAGVALVSGYVKHRSGLSLVLGGLGLAFVWLALFIPGCVACDTTGATDVAHSHSPRIAGLPAHNVVTSVGSILLIAAHAINWRACRKGTCASHCHEH